MFKQTKRFLLASVSFLIVLCITIFIWIGIYMNKKSEVAIGDIGKIYMSEMSKQLQQKFDAIIDLRLSQMDGIVLRTPPYNVKYSEALMEELAGTENRISVERNRYNESVKMFNSKIRKFPTSVVARLMGVEKRDYFEAQSGAEQAPNVEF